MGKPYKSGQRELLFRMIFNFDTVKQQQEAIIAEKRQCLHYIALSLAGSILIAMDGEIVRAAIGRTKAIGDLYDARTDTFCGVSLLKKTPPDSAVELMDNGLTDVKFIHSDTYKDKFEKLHVSAELKLSILCGLFSLGGSGKYLKDERKSARAVRSSLLYNIQTKSERLNIFNDELVDCFSLDALQVKSATHVVVGVEWGANSMITMEYSNSENRNKEEIQGELQGALNKFSSSISESRSGDYTNNEEKKEMNYKFHVFGDIMPTDEELPQTSEEALRLMKRLPKLILTANEGKGKPLNYTMVPLTALEKYLKVEQMADRMVKEVNEQLIVRYVQLFDGISAAKQELYDLYENLSQHKYCVSHTTIQEVGSMKNKLDTAEAELRSNLSKLLVEVRSKRAGAEQLEALIDETLNGAMSVNKIRDFIYKYSVAVDKINFVNLLRGEGVTYIGADYSDSLESEKLKNIDGEIYVLFFENTKAISEYQHVSDNKQRFLRMAKLHKEEENNSLTGDEPGKKTRGKSFIAVDLEMRPELSAAESVKSGTRICHYRNGKYINTDVLLEYLTRNERCLMRSSEEIELTITKPNNRIILEIRCPGSLAGLCAHTKHSWFCYKCEELIDHGFDGYFYCGCGRAPNDSFEFKCNDEKHGSMFIEYTKDQLNQLLATIRPMKEMNILILGETGVGKSTWINGLANYMTFKSLDDAEQSKPLSLIAASFMMTDENFEMREIRVGDDKNEVLKAGQSATQSPKSYVLDWGKTLVRLIDTPGIGDTRGIDQDKKNFDEILRYIANLQELHGICILLKPNNARLTVMFQFCIKELLTHLHRSASDNIVFCFTNARSTFYRPGDTLPALQSLLDDNQEVKIELSKHTIYCMDNESFRFLCAVQNQIQFGEEERKIFSVSWDKSVSEINRLFKHISGLKPHTTKDTISLNDARKVILNLTEPMANISKNIQLNIAIIQDKQNEIMSSEKSQKELLDKLYVPQIFLNTKPIDYPRTVCTSSRCTENSSIPGTKEHIKKYVTLCHNPCGLRGVEREVYPNPELKNCAAMGPNHNCTICGCGWDQHMHIYFEYDTQSKNVLDESVQNLINSKKSDQEKIEVFIDKMESDIKQLQKEQDIITSISVKFGSFLKSNAIAPYNDALKEYLELLIRQEKDKVNAGGDQKSLTGLESMLNKYLEEKRVLDLSMADHTNTEIPGPNEVNDMVNTLYALPINGKQLKNIMDVSLASKAKMRATYTETHFSSRRHLNKFKSVWKKRATYTETDFSSRRHFNTIKSFWNKVKLW